tara:strand:- start:365 stop:622 length:258 start_codon:yes stop_codon:yes gene_type:complete
MAQFFNSTLLRLRQVLAETGDSRSWLYQRIQDKRFPAPVKCGGISKWPAREVAAMNEAEVAGKTEAEIRQLVKDLVSRRTAGEGQ